jgi:hypothetical protein
MWGTRILIAFKGIDDDDDDNSDRERMKVSSMVK